MGICFNDVKLMSIARSSGAKFDNILTIGRQSLTLHPSEIKDLHSLGVLSCSKESALSKFKFGCYADQFLLECLKAKSVTSMDFSNYEGANIIHDLNLPVDESLHGSFDVVIDGGTLEHIFNFPVAIANLMKMTRVDGRIFTTTPANNLCGHGMYQFSPELMFRIFSEENGFEMINLHLLEAQFPSVELTKNGKLFKVKDPAKVNDRVSFMNKKPVMMMVEAKKISEVTNF